MVRIISFNERISESGKRFFSMTVQGGIELIKSQRTGGFYATARKASVPTTFDEETCKALIGTEMPGSIQKQACEPYEYTIKETGETIHLTHRYVYVPEEKENHNRGVLSDTTSSNGVEPNVNQFSKNGVLEHA